MREWKQLDLGQLIILNYGKALKAEHRVEGPVPVYSSAGITGSHNTHLVSGEGIIIGRKGTVGKVYYSPTAFCCIDTAYYILPNPSRYNFKYLYYLLHTLGLEELNEDSAVPGLNRETAYNQNILLPPLPEQQAIAAVLSSLDDKIDLLHRQNKTLEAMAETLFRQWFIEEAKEDWEEGVLGEIASNIRENININSIGANDKYIGLEHVDRRNIALSKYGLGSDISSNKSRFQSYDILFGKLRPYFHKVCITPFEGICSTDILVLRPKAKIWTAYTLFAFFQDSVVEFANLGSGGTRMPRADWKALSQYPISIPPLVLVEKFESIVGPSIDKIFSNLNQIQTLEKLRDTLLPKLMSGEVRVQFEEQTQ